MSIQTELLSRRIGQMAEMGRPDRTARLCLETETRYDLGRTLLRARAPQPAQRGDRLGRLFAGWELGEEVV